MNKVVNNILMLSTGLLMGASAGYIYAKKRCEEIAEEEIAEMRVVLQEALRKKKATIMKDAESIDELSSTVEAPQKKTKTRERYDKLVNKLEYGKESEIVEEETMEEKVEAEEYHKYEQISTEAANHYESDGPYVITSEQFSEEMDHYDKSTIYYYEDDDTLADEAEEIIADVESIVGTSALTSFGDGSDDPEVVYVRNDKLTIDYEIIRLSKSYSETILGISNEGRGRIQRKGRGLDE